MSLSNVIPLTQPESVLGHSQPTFQWIIVCSTFVSFRAFRSTVLATSPPTVPQGSLQRLQHLKLKFNFYRKFYGRWGINGSLDILQLNWTKSTNWYLPYIIVLAHSIVNRNSENDQFGTVYTLELYSSEIGRLVDSCALFAQNGMYMMSHGQKAM